MNVRKRVSGIIFWPPRILAILFVIFLGIMSLNGLSARMSWQQFLNGLFVNNIPTLIVMAVLLVSWEIEIIGGLAFLLIGAGYYFYADSLPGIQFWLPEIPWNLSIIIPTLVIGFLFIINWIGKRKLKADERKIDPF